MQVQSADNKSKYEITNGGIWLEKRNIELTAPEIAG
jgi:hypothetical protein